MVDNQIPAMQSQELFFFLLFFFCTIPFVCVHVCMSLLSILHVHMCTHMHIWFVCVCVCHGGCQT